MPGVLAPHVAKALRYAEDVVAGNIDACKWVRLACKRHLDDLQKSLSDPAWPYRFDEIAAEKICNFAEMLPHVKGDWAKRQELIVLQGWQCFCFCVMFGWLKRKNGRRRFREAYLKIPRKNGKSVIAAVIGLYLWCFDGEVGAEVYSGATTEKQAWEVFRPAKWMLERTPDLLEFVGFGSVWAKSLVTDGDQSRFEPVIGKPGDGASPSCAIADEFHEHDSPDLVDTMQTGMLARTQPLMLMITTAGYNLAGPCYDKELEMQRLLDQAVIDSANDEVFCVMYGIDEAPYLWNGKEVAPDDWASPKVLRKANPNFGISVDEDILESMQRQAVLNPIEQNKFKTKHLNVWCAARVAWMPLAQWHLCRQEPPLELSDFKGKMFYGILDLASRDDLAVYMRLFPEKIKGQLHYYIFATYYLPEDTVDNPGPNTATYQKWRKQGLLTVTDGAEIDFDRIETDVIESKAGFKMRELIFDPWRATQLAQRLGKQGITCVELRQTVQMLSTPMKEVLSAVKGNRLHHDGNPVTTWMVANVTATLDAKDNIYPRKEKPHMKIDGAVALIMGTARAMLEPKAGIDKWLENPVSVAKK